MYEDPHLNPQDKQYYENRIYHYSRERRAAIRAASEAMKARYVQVFLTEYCEADPLARTPLSKLYERYLLIYPEIAPGIRSPESKVMFSKYLQMSGYSKARGRIGDFQGVFIKGLKLAADN